MAITASPLTISPLHPLFAAEVSGVDLTRPLDDPTFERIAAAFDEHSVLVFHGQALTDEEQMAFSERWGPLETTVFFDAGKVASSRSELDFSNLQTAYGFSVSLMRIADAVARADFAFGDEGARVFINFGGLLP